MKLYFAHLTIESKRSSTEISYGIYIFPFIARAKKLST